MSAFAVKMIALVTMITDHTGVFLFNKIIISPEIYLLMRRIGRIGFPLFAFMLSNGFDKSSDRVKYLSRLILFAAISQIPFTLGLLDQNYFPSNNNIEGIGVSLSGWVLVPAIAVSAAAWFFLVRRDRTALYVALAVGLAGIEAAYRNVWLLNSQLNVFYTLAFSMAVMCLAERIRMKEDRPLVTVLLAAVLGALMYLFCDKVDYGWLGVALIIGMWFFRGSRALQAIWLCFWAYYEYSAGLDFLSLYSVGCAAAAIPILLYNGQRGVRSKWLFYWAYPVHLVILGILNIMI